MIFKNLFKGSSRQSEDERKREAISRSLLRREAKIGGEVFGPLPDGVRREFFCLDPKTWIWHEEWTGKDGRRKTRTTRYDIRPNAILKAQDGSGYHLVSMEEALHLQAAAHAYQKRVKSELYADIV